MEEEDHRGRQNPCTQKGVPREVAWGEGRGWVLRCSTVTVAPHVVILLEECVVLDSPLLQLHIQAAPVDRHHLADAAGPQGVCGWAALPPNSRIGHGRERPHTAGGPPQYLAHKEEPMDWGTWGVCLERNSETAGHGEGTSITGGTKKRGQDPFLLVVPTEPGAELHEGCQRIASGGWQGHMGLQHLLQQCQHLLFLHLCRDTGRNCGAPCLSCRGPPQCTPDIGLT